jgi:hypothetical protein
MTVGRQDDVGRAAEALHELALVLRHVPVAEHTRELHLRALRLKRDVERWRERVPDARERRSVLEELERLRGDAAVFAEVATLVHRAAGRQDEGTT